MIVAADGKGAIRGFVAVGRGGSEKCLEDLKGTGGAAQAVRGLLGARAGDRDAPGKEH